MTDLVVIVPSRGRPGAARELADSFEATCTADTTLLIALDGDDRKLEEYVDVRYLRYVGEHQHMVHALNMAAVVALAQKPTAVGFMGDDHRPRTKGWDRLMCDALPGIVYGDDLLQRENLPTHVVMSAGIVRALGHIAPPTLRHMYVDNYWRDLGRTAGVLRYLPDVVIEHLHPVAGKADWDDGYKRVNAPEVFAADLKAYEAYKAQRLFADAAAVRKVCAT